MNAGGNDSFAPQQVFDEESGIDLAPIKSVAAVRDGSSDSKQAFDEESYINNEVENEDDDPTSFEDAVEIICCKSFRSTKKT